MIDSVVAWLTSMLQNDPELLAGLLIGQVLWCGMNTILIVVFTHSDIENIIKALRKRGIWV